MLMHMLMLFKFSLGVIEILPLFIDTIMEIMQVLEIVEICNRNTQFILVLIIVGVFTKHGKQVQQRGLPTHQIVCWRKELVGVRQNSVRRRGLLGSFFGRVDLGG